MLQDNVACKDTELLCCCGSSDNMTCSGGVLAGNVDSKHDAAGEIQCTLSHAVACACRKYLSKHNAVAKAQYMMRHAVACAVSNLSAVLASLADLPHRLHAYCCMS